jgi:hypothetical protein
MYLDALALGQWISMCEYIRKYIYKARSCASCLVGGYRPGCKDYYGSRSA